MGVISAMKKLHNITSIPKVYSAKDPAITINVGFLSGKFLAAMFHLTELYFKLVQAV